ncbi:ABC transporter permease [Kibdelosporangium philippinense]|uniref:Autoinducer 2 import system permease protein LsrD n=1 Tax=Kibdelosporangium philippinense TaxID=211113 RepID=A0ABS8Z5P1_9PSEU|nr:ABC transporter permease [Kibdelosporangium philippinense]MCE7002349.1 ABC transporter permease [Kibdelosporangium philippinense]
MKRGVYVILVVLLVALVVANPNLLEPGQPARFLGRMAPIVIVTIGQYFVLVAGEFDLSAGAVIAVQVVLAGNLIGSDDAMILPVLGLMVVLAVAVGLVNGLVTTILRVPGFITTLGMMLVLSGITFYATGGAASGNPSDTFRNIGRSGPTLPVLGYVPWSVMVLLAVLIGGAWLMRRPFGRLLLAVGDNEDSMALAGARVWWLRTRAYVLSALLATVAAILLVGYAGTHPTVGQGYQYTAIAGAVIGGVALGGGRGWLLSAAAGAAVLETLISLLNIIGIESTWRDTVQGAVILAALGAAGVQWKRLSGQRITE